MSCLTEVFLFKDLVPFGIYGYIQASDTDRQTRHDIAYMGYVVGFSRFHRPQEKMLLRIKNIDQPLPGHTAHGFPELQIKQSDQIRYDCWETVREELTKKQIRTDYFNRFKKKRTIFRCLHRKSNPGLNRRS